MAPNDWVSEITEHIRRLGDFRGRETRLDYWSWVIAMAVVAGSLATIVLFFQIFDAFDDGLGSGAFTRLRNQFIDARLWAVIAFLVMIAAATTRRLHDAGKRAWPALIPAALVVASTWIFGRLFKGLPDPAGEVIDRIAEAGDDLAAGNLNTTAFDVVRDGVPSGPRVRDASASELALTVGVTLATIVAAVPILIGLVRKGDPEANDYGEPPVSSVA